MSNVLFPNFALDTNSANNSFSALWKLTRAMKKSGWKVLSDSNGNATKNAISNGADAWGTSGDPASDTYPIAFDTKQPWLVMAGPITMKVPITVASTGTFLRGEKITQAGSGVEGECLGYVYDATSTTGWMVVGDRTGMSITASTNAYVNSWTTGVITGSSSGATLTPSATPLAYVREIMFQKTSVGNVTAGSCYYICADAVGENASLFSVLAGAAGCTATVGPGAGGTSNGFPSAGLVVFGNGGSVSGISIFQATNAFGKAQVCAVNTTPITGTTADGTFWAMVGNTNATNTWYGLGLFRLDDSEPGDIDPYIWLYADGNGTGSFSRTSSTTAGAALNTSSLGSLSSIGWKGYSNRVMSTTPTCSYFYPAWTVTAIGSAVQASVQNQASTMQTQNYPGASLPITRESILMMTDLTSHKMFKGRLRWMSLFPIGAGTDTADNKQWLIVLGQSSTTNPAFGVGPWDGTTTPLPS